MRKTIIFGAAAAILGLAAVAQASELPASDLGNGSQTTGQATQDAGRTVRHDRSEGNEHTRKADHKADDQAGAARGHSNEANDDDYDGDEGSTHKRR